MDKELRSTVETILSMDQKERDAFFMKLGPYQLDIIENWLEQYEQELEK